MALSQATLKILDGGLGIAPATGDQVQAKIGTSSAGPINMPQLVLSTKTASDLFGTGPLVEAAIAALQVPGSGGVFMCRVPSTVAGVVGTVAPGTGNTGSATYTVTGTPLDAYDLTVKIVAGGANLAAGTAQFQLSLDGGDSFSDVLQVPVGGSYAIPGTGLTLGFVNGGTGTSFVAGDTASVGVSAPGYSSGDLMTAVDAVVNNGQPLFLVHAVGQASTMANAMALAASLSSKLTAQEAAFHYVAGVIELPADTDAAIKTAKGTSAFPRVMLVADFVELAELDGTIRKRHAAWPVTARAGSVRAAEDLGRVKSGPLLNVTRLYRNEETTPGLEAAGITTLRSVAGKSGFYVASPQMAEAVGSDYSLLQFRRVIDIAAKVIRSRATDLLRDDLPIDKTGTIDEAFARSVESELKTSLSVALVETNNASIVSVALDRTGNILSTNTVDISYRIVPKGYAFQLTGTLGFTNPALAAA
jgi:hypothetical protein